MGGRPDQRKWLFLLAAGALGCTLPLKAPPLRDYALGPSRASYREYGAAGTAALCDAEPRWLFDELAGINSLLDRFVRATDLGAGDRWPDERFDMLVAALSSLEPVLQQHELNLTAATRCSFVSQRGFPDLLERGRELLAESRARLAEAPQLVATVRARRALEAWREELPQRQFAARQGCPPGNRSGPPRLYFAYQSEAGETLWLFCDGARVTAARGGSPEFSFPEGLSKRELKRIKPRPYLDAARAFPGTEVSRAPAVEEE